MEWTREKTLALINEYRKRRGLWDMTHDDYRKKDVKHKLLVEVSATLGGGIPIVEVEKKFHTLRTQYHREINRMKRKEPYNSKWFGFKNLQFLSSPKACRSNKGRIRSEITEDGTVTTKYVITEEPVQKHETSACSANSSNNNENEEYLTMRRKQNIVFEAVSGSTSASRSHELEKLIEETTKDVDDVEEPKPKLTVRDRNSVQLEHHAYNTTTQIHSSAGGEITTNGQQQDEQLQHHHNQSQQPQIEDEVEHIETIDLHATDDESTVYQSVNASGNQTSVVPTRIIKIQRRETTHDDLNYYDADNNQTTESAGVHHSLISDGTTSKRIYYDSNGHTTAILATPGAATSIVGSPQIKLHQNRNSMSQQQLQAMSSPRDEFATYGEYVGNEIRSITSREILIALKHKINTALFEANMAELQK